ncbi:MAG TPA: nucleoside hydrolase [Acidimicrobiales bacterium]|nr:nucleoside hydrolase [Acidimicrobiales bacterium]
MERRTAFLLVVALVAAAACDDGSRTTSAPTTQRSPVVVDTDGGSDDAIALLYLLQHPDVDVIGITVSGTGIVHCDPGVANVLGWVELAAAGDVPVSCGRAEPVAGERSFPEAWRTQADGRYDGILPVGRGAADPRPAARLMRDLVTDEGGLVTVLALGPLTNVADALESTPEMAEAIGSLVVMGGAFDVPGNVDLPEAPAAAATEWNLYVDPAAAQAVLDADIEVTFVPLDSAVGIDAFDVRALARAASSPAGRAAADLLLSSPFFTSPGFALWDPLAAAVVAEPGAFVSSERPTRIVVDGPEAGRTVADGGRPVLVARPQRAGAFVAGLLGVLSGAGPPLDVDRSPDLSVAVGEGTCVASDQDLAAGPVVLDVGTRGAVAIGVMDPDRDLGDVEALLASGAPAAAPEWFPLVALLQGGGPVVARVDPGQLDVVCIDVGADGALHVAGHVELTVRASDGP